MKDVLCLVSSTIDDRLSAGARYALALARSHGANLSALIAEIEPHVSSFPPEPDIMQVDKMAGERPSQVERLKQTADRLLSAAQLANVTCEIFQAEGQPRSVAETMIFLAQVRDVAVVDVCGPLNERRKELVDRILFGGGRPLVLVPQKALNFANDRIMIAWDATRSATRAVHDALPLLTQANEVTIVSVIDDKALLMPDSGDRLRRYLERWDVDVKVNSIHRDFNNIGMSLLAHARHIGANLLIMGGHAHGFERTLVLGSATKDIFSADLEIPVLLSH